MSEAYRPPPASGSRPANDVDDDEAQAIRDEANGHDPAKPRWPEPSELALRLGTGGARLPLGLKHVDEAWRGGARMGAVLGVMGQPGAGKTTLLIFLTHNWVRGGIPVSFICADEDREGVIIRLGQQIGIQRKWLEDGLPSSRTDLADHLEGRPLMLLDPDEDDPLVDVSTAAEALRQRHPDGPAVLVFDSLQSLARRIPDVIADNARSKVDMCLKAMKSAAKRYGLLVVFTSEMNRGSYRMNDNSFSNDLAAGKESGSIEYEATAIMMLKTLPDDPGLVVVSFPKSRMGKVEPFALRQNYETATFASDRMPEPSTKRDPEAARSAAVEKACQLILEALEKEPMNKRALRAHVGGNASVVDSAVSELLRSGAISFTVGLRGAMLFDRVRVPAP